MADDRTPGLRGTPNGRLIDDSLHHDVLLHRHAVSNRNDVLEFLNDEAIPDLEARILYRIRRLRAAVEERGDIRGGATIVRLNELHRALVEQVNAASAEIASQQSSALSKLGVAETAWAAAVLKRAIPVRVLDLLPDVRFDRLPLSVIQKIIDAQPFDGKVLADHWGDLGTGLIAKIESEVQRGMVAGETMDQISERVFARGRDSVAPAVMDLWRRDASAIARTSVMGISNEVRHATFLENDDIIASEKWVATLEPGRTCVACGLLDGEEWELGEPHPRPTLHPNCFPGDVEVIVRSGIRAVTKRPFDGELVVIRTAAARTLRCTPNHPILTDRGWLAASLLREGDHVVSDGVCDGESAIGPHDDEIPTRIEEVAEAFLRSRGVSAVPVPVSAVDFHGDAVDGDVAVVGTDCDLEPRAHPALLKEPRELLLVVRHPPIWVPLSGERSAGKHLRAVRSPALRSVCRCREREALARGEPSHPRELLLTPVAGTPTAPPQESPHGLWRAAEAECAGDAGSADAGIEHPQSSRAHPHRDRASIDSRTENAALRESSSDDAAADAVLASKIREGLAGPVFLDEIVHVHREPFAGHVFNLETETGFYVANGVIVHNCRCTIVPITNLEKELKKRGLLDDLPPSTRASISGPVPDTLTWKTWLAESSPAMQDRILGPGRAALYRRGTVPIEQFVIDSDKPLTLRQLLELEGLVDPT